jgi:hypothetical protein
VSINWQSLRPWNGSQQTAFEELCCQLARTEQTPAGSLFVRKGTPDAGVECFWKLPEGGEWGWQAKFFLSPPNNKQWSELDDSFRTAIAKHPDMVSYTVCLPLDRSDARQPNQKSFLDKWNDRVQKWQKLASSVGRTIEFQYWGEHEIWARLSQDRHRGRYRFWFDREFFSTGWFRRHVEEVVANAGPRYSPELHVNLPIARLFDALGRTPAFLAEIISHYKAIFKSYSGVRIQRIENKSTQAGSLEEKVSQILELLKNSPEAPTAPFPLLRLEELSSLAYETCWECSRTLEPERHSVTPSNENGTASHQSSLEDKDPFQSHRYHLRELAHALSSLKEFASTNSSKLANIPALLVVGPAGTGKTHLLCDAANYRAQRDWPTILLLGGQFTDDDPWSQITRRLGLTLSKEDLLAGLDAAAEARNCRALILIDALNEGQGRQIWKQYLGGLLTTLRRYPHLGLAITVRSSYEELLIPVDLIGTRLIRLVHHGFADYEYEATKTFFDHFKIQRPSIPLLAPEFQNPLFLKLFCLGLRNRGHFALPMGLSGITGVFEDFIDSVNEVVSQPERLDYDPKRKLVQVGLDQLAFKMYEGNTSWLRREEARAILDEIHPGSGYENSLFRHLIAEGLLSEDINPVESEGSCDVVRFAYERIADHVIAKRLIDMTLSARASAGVISRRSRIGALLKDESACWTNQGLVEALAIQIPERLHKELPELATWCAEFESVRAAFISSLIWRRPDATSAFTVRYINSKILKYHGAAVDFWDAVIMVATRPNYPFNADSLHKYLVRQKLAERDEWWSVFLHRQAGQKGAVDRLVEWANSLEDKSHIDDEAIRLCAITLAWFLTTSHRSLRDRATKSLVRLLCDRLPILQDMLQRFHEVNDLYVAERLYAAAYGCAMRQSKPTDVLALAGVVYELVFKSGKPPPHILLRDYARGVIEIACRCTSDLRPEIAKARPPYQSAPPKRVRNVKSLNRLGDWKEGMPEGEWARVNLCHSVMGSGDFARYIIGTNSGHFHWSNRPLHRKRRPTRKEMIAKFEGSLNPTLSQTWKELQNLLWKIGYLKTLAVADRKAKLGIDITEKQLDNVLEGVDSQFQNALSPAQRRLYRKHVKRFVTDGRRDDESRFELSVAQTWILQKLIDLGWTVGRFGRFDREVAHWSDLGRSAHKAERIGKKYQWLAYHEFLARVADNFEFREDYGERRGLMRAHGSCGVAT